MTTNNPPRRFVPMSQLATDDPVLLIDTEAPIRELHNCVSERLNARVLVQNVRDVFRVIEPRGFDAP